MILFDESNLSPVRRRTLERLTNAALKLYQEKKFPTPEEITQEADYAKVTLKSYFSSHSEFIEYVVKQVIGSFVTPPMGKNAEENVENLLHWGYGEIEKHEALMRDALRISQQRWLANGVQEEISGSMLKKSNRKASLTQALEPLAPSLPEDTRNRLVMLLSVLYGTEALVVLKDTFGLTQEEITDLTSWGARLLIRQALAEA
ncbi:TetR/AcrR family transcriptional regulator [Enterobacillus tribolii]|uniref:TetR family transcriptional regulator n=1 Tax=Enterobacillus tribolii TaxID=1487935 RepID=A0A370R2Q8_9GAMM|nr:TetR/AcrR family transcriptional regulator [Enterobacillus tribolii]MBW7983070.1 TetR/AcrR family transcriptional regulator [Enterobacillus tribolii]RDK95826.1 TetR family transcriptional regulator [Enterobacillus tribolii]